MLTLQSFSLSKYFLAAPRQIPKGHRVTINLGDFVANDVAIRPPVQGQITCNAVSLKSREVLTLFQTSFDFKILNKEHGESSEKEVSDHLSSS